MGNLDLPAHKIQAGAPFGDRVLDLQPGVHLQEEEFARLPVDEEFAGTGTHVPDRRRRAHRDLAHLLPQLRRDHRGGRLLDDLLVSPLHAALALAQPDTALVLVGEDLDLDVPRPRDRFLQVDARVAERGQRLAPGGRQGGVEFARLGHEAHALPAAAGRCLEQDGVANLLRVALRLLFLALGDRLLEPGDDGNSRGAHLAPRAGLLAHLFHRLRRRADEDQSGVAARARERGVLAEKAVPGVDRVRPRLSRGGDHVLDRQIALARWRRPDAHGLVAAAHVKRGAIRVAEDRHGPDSHLAAGARHAHRDLSPIRDEDLLDAQSARTSHRAGNLSRERRWEKAAPPEVGWWPTMTTDPAPG